MSEGIINQILEVEKNCDQSVEDAKKKAETIKSEAKVNSKNYYDTSVRNAFSEYQKKVDAANEKAKQAIDEATKSAGDLKNQILSKTKAKQDKAIDAIIAELV